MIAPPSRPQAAAGPRRAAPGQAIVAALFVIAIPMGVVAVKAKIRQGRYLEIRKDLESPAEAARLRAAVRIWGEFARDGMRTAEVEKLFAPLPLETPPARAAGRLDPPFLPGMRLLRIGPDRTWALAVPDDRLARSQSSVDDGRR